MENIITIFKKELKSYFDSAMAYIIIVVFVGLLGWFFTSSLFLVNLATLRSFFETAPFLLLFFGPAITMRLISEEKKSGTIELLATKPIQDYEIIIGKFLSAWALFVIALLPTLIYYFTITILGDIEIGPVIGGYLGLILVGAVFIAIGVFGSTLTENQVVAFIISFLFVFILFILDKILMFAPGFLASILEYISIDYHFSNIARGVIDTRDLIYYISAIVLMLYLSTVVISKRRWA
ncbi:MAG: gliding motility protein GldF [Ignavibacteriae bacterium]|nr:MAG: gliding motility protein GldF [Ignavibacteriota bacterium]